ncbi:MAG TPA: RNA 2',3'-cyclic phosphodiesterase [Bacteroides sp.]|nr:RNA 2',3'-cyclic phosphodiesterase [Bacteroides sp.]
MNHGYYRTFVGVPLQVSPRFLSARDELMEMLAGERISWVDPSRYHITLRFIGDTRPSEIRKISHALKEVVEVPVKQHLLLESPGSFGNRKQPRVLWIGLLMPEILFRLKEMTDAALQQSGIPPEEQPFHPHLTIGRIRNRVDSSAFHASVEAMRYRFREEVQVDKLVFYRSEPGRGGPVYTPLTRLDFKDQDI